MFTESAIGLFTIRSAARFGSEPTGFQIPRTLNWIRGKTHTRMICPAGSSTCGSTTQLRVTGTHGYLRFTHGYATKSLAAVAQKDHRLQPVTKPIAASLLGDWVFVTYNFLFL